MKFYTRWVHRIVRSLSLEGPLVAIGTMVPFVKKMLPLPEEYQPGNFIKVFRDGAYYNVDRSDYMQWHLYAGLEDLSWTKAVSVLPAGGVILDIGANAGQFSIKLAAALSKRNLPYTIHAFEPNPEIFRLLSANVWLNPVLADHVQCHPLALGKEKGVVDFSYSPGNSGGGSVSNGRAHAGHRVAIDSLDSIAKSLSLLSLDFVKIDVEGFEPEVLIGSDNVISKFRPWIYIEITPSWFAPRGHTLSQIIDRMLEWKYQLSGEYSGKFIPFLENEQLFRSLHQFNLLAKPSHIGQ